MLEISSKAHAGKDAAIIGIACTYPGARNKDQFWNNIVRGHDAVCEVSPERWDPDRFYDPDPSNPDKIYSKMGGWIGSSFAFNPLKHGVMPSALNGTEPDHMLVLRTVYEALEDAGYLPGQNLDGRRVNVIVGKGNYQGPGATALMYRGIVTEIVIDALRGLHPNLDDEALKELRAKLRRDLPPFNGEVAGGLIPNICTGRVANRMDFMGRNFTIDAACASSLIAAEIGMNDLAGGTADLVLVGGVHIFAYVPFLQVFDAMRAMSMSSTIRPFDENCDGTMSGEGVGILALKRLEDAERDGDRIYAVIRGAGSSSDGKAKGVTAPRPEGEELAMRRAYESSGIDPHTVGLIEGHGTGTPVGDASEVEAMRRVFGPVEGDWRQTAVGSVKSMIGHAMPAAGAAGLIKTALSLYHRTLPPTLHCETPRKDLEEAGFYVNTQTRPWIRPESEGPRRAGVSAFGFGGVNAHVLLEQHTGPEPKTTLVRDWPTELITLSGPTREELLAEIDRVQRYAAVALETPLRNLAATVNAAAPEGPYRFAVVASSMADLAAKLNGARERLANPDLHSLKDRQGLYFFDVNEIRDGKVAVLFPGEGSQYLDMLSDLCLHFPVVRQSFERADGARRDRGRKPTSAVVFPPPTFTAEQRAAREAELFSIDRATESVLTGGGAIYRLLDELGVQADMMTGHSAGEWVAMAASGVLDIDQFVDSLANLGRLYDGLADRQDIPKRTMLAVGAGRAKVEAALNQIDKSCEIANDNCHHQVVIVVAPEDEKAVMEQLLSLGLFVEKLPYDRGYHTPAFTYICEPLREYFSSLDVRGSGVPLYCSTTAEPYPADRDGILERVTETFSRPLLFRQTIERMYADGARVFIEAGPRGNLTAFVDDILRGKPHVAAPVDTTRRDGISNLHHALGMLFAAGVDMNLAALYERRYMAAIAWDPKADRPENPDEAAGVVEISTCYPHLASLDPMPEPEPRVVEVPVEVQVPVASAQPAPAAPAPLYAGGGIQPQGSLDASMAQHLSLMEEFLATHETIMHAAMGSAPVVETETTTQPAASPQPAPSSKHVNGSAANGAYHEPVAPAPPPPPAPEPPPVVVPEPVEQAASVPEPVAAPAEAPGQDLTALLLSIVSERTGYPEDMLELDLDMEADLGIDSIKRVEILGSLQESLGPSASGDVDMEVVGRLKTLREVISHLDGAGSSAAPAADAAKPEVREALIRNAEELEHTLGESLTLRVPVSADVHRYLADHCLYFNDSDYGNQLPAILSMPQTGNLELMAETAARLRPGKKVIGAKAVRSLRWVNFDTAGTPVNLLLKARRLADDRISVKLANEATEKDVLSEAVIVFGDDYPAAPAPLDEALQEPRRPEKAGDNPYTEHRFFHGPSFQGITDLHTVARNGVEAKLTVLPQDELLAGDPAPKLWTDPFLLDAGGQLVGYWPNEYADKGFVVLPVGLNELNLYGPPPAPGVTLDARVRVRNLTEKQLVADFDLVDPAGKLVLSVKGWTDWRFYWSPRIYEFWRFSNRAFNGETVETPFPDQLELRRIEDLDESERQGLWHDMWMRVVLDPAEYAEYQAVSGADAKTEWAFVRASEKDAARAWMKRHGGGDLYPCDVAFETLDGGRRRAVGEWVSRPDEAPFVDSVYRDRIAFSVASPYPVALVEGQSAAQPGEELAAAAVAKLLGPGERALTPPVSAGAPWTVSAEGGEVRAAAVTSGELRVGVAWRVQS